VLSGLNKSVGPSRRTELKFFVDTAETAEIKSLASGGRLAVVTTHPSLVAKTGKEFADVNRALTDKGLAAFLADWSKTGRSITSGH
jgi:transaldolase